jgi:hypothetical protein
MSDIFQSMYSIMLFVHDDKHHAKFGFGHDVQQFAEAGRISMTHSDSLAHLFREYAAFVACYMVLIVSNSCLVDPLEKVSRHRSVGKDQNIFHSTLLVGIYNYLDTI